MSNSQERLAAARVALSSLLAAHVEYDALVPEAPVRAQLHLAAEAVARASHSPTLFGVLDNLDSALAALANGVRELERPAPPTSLPPREHGGRIDVRATDDVAWSDDYETWIVHYTTTDARVPSEFRAWRAVWVDGAWEAAEV